MLSTQSNSELIISSKTPICNANRKSSTASIHLEIGFADGFDLGLADGFDLFPAGFDAVERAR